MDSGATAEGTLRMTMTLLSPKLGTPLYISNIPVSHFGGKQSGNEYNPMSYHALRVEGERLHCRCYSGEQSCY
jgi:hypothetical protein